MRMTSYVWGEFIQFIALDVFDLIIFHGHHNDNNFMIVSQRYFGIILPSLSSMVAEYIDGLVQYWLD